MELAKYLGAQYHFQDLDDSNPDAVRSLQVEMGDYIRNACKNFTYEFGGKLGRVTTPFISDAEWSDPCDAVGRFQSTCGSHVATFLFVVRVCRPDGIAAVNRLCSNVSRWTVVDDKALVRLASYFEHFADDTLVGSLSPSDEDGLYLELYSDADWNGDPTTTKSTSGVWYELASTTSSRTFPVAWGGGKQTASASSSAESETVAASASLRKEGIPLQVLFEALLGKRLPIVLNLDNTQAISAISKVYSKRLRYLSRTHRVSIGVIHECVQDQEMAITVAYCPTDRQKADIFTKTLVPAKFVRAKEMVSLRNGVLK